MTQWIISIPEKIISASEIIIFAMGKITFVIETIFLARKGPIGWQKGSFLGRDRSFAPQKGSFLAKIGPPVPGKNHFRDSSDPPDDKIDRFRHSRNWLDGKTNYFRPEKILYGRKQFLPVRKNSF